MKACPFCGSTNLRVVQWTDDTGEFDAIECNDCLGAAPCRHWNKRAEAGERLSPDLANPFANEDGVGAVAVDDRLHMVERFDLIQCLIALDLPHLQKTVEKKLRVRIRKLERETASLGWECAFTTFKEARRTLIHQMIEADIDPELIDLVRQFRASYVPVTIDELGDKS